MNQLTQMSYRGGFALKASGAYDGKLTTGRADWQVGVLSGTTMGVEFVGHGAMGTRATSAGSIFSRKHRHARWIPSPPFGGAHSNLSDATEPGMDSN